MSIQNIVLKTLAVIDLIKIYPDRERVTISGLKDEYNGFIELYPNFMSRNDTRNKSRFVNIINFLAI